MLIIEVLLGVRTSSTSLECSKSQYSGQPHGKPQILNIVHVNFRSFFPFIVFDMTRSIAATTLQVPPHLQAMPTSSQGTKCERLFFVGAVAGRRCSLTHFCSLFRWKRIILIHIGQMTFWLFFLPRPWNVLYILHCSADYVESFLLMYDEVERYPGPTDTKLIMRELDAIFSHTKEVKTFQEMTAARKRNGL